jgi:ABC-type sugar transport system ATPase subunit
MELRTNGLTKQYPGCLALDHISVRMEGGKCYALLGKNGSGKSTFVKTFAGVLHPDSGELFLGGEKLFLKTPTDAYEKGIVTVYQEMSLVPGLTVAENIFLNRMPKKYGMIDWRKVHKEAARLLEIMDVDIDPARKIQDLGMWQKQIVEITKAMSFNPKVLMLDEPTSSLAQNEVKNLHNVVNKLKQNQDIIIIYITHKMQELPNIADNLIILRDGKLIGQYPFAELDHRGIIEKMFGEVSIRSRPRDIVVKDNVVLHIEKLCRRHRYRNITLDLHEGEVLGIAGMLGSGRTEVLRGIFGADPVDSGSIHINGKRITRPNPIRMKKEGIALTPEERKLEGLILIHSIVDNLCYASMGRTSLGIIENKKMRLKVAQKQIADLQIKIPDIKSECRTLSGGNQQKVVVGNWLNTLPSVMIYDEPSRGIDVNAKQQIFEIMWEQARKGISTIFVSSELEELLEVCHRIIIMRDGEFVGQVNPDDISINELYAYAMGKEIPENMSRPYYKGGKVK